VIVFKFGRVLKFRRGGATTGHRAGIWERMNIEVKKMNIV
jgi:hypothetical protein